MQQIRITIINHKQRIRTCTSGLLLQNRCRSSKIEHQKHDREFIKPKISLTDKSNQIAKESFQIKIFQIWIQIKAHKVSTLQPTMASHSTSLINGIPTPEASHSISKALSKLGKQSKGALVSLSFNKLKVFLCISVHLNTIFFLTSSFKGAASELKFFTNLL